MKKRSNKCLLIILFILISLSSKAQFDYAAVDSNTYKLYYYQQWSRLIEYGDSAIENGIDYMFLRQRIGVAYFYLQDYRMASYHFEKALAFNSDDNFTLYYLYYSYLYSGRQADANFITQKMTDYAKADIKWKNKYISSVYLEGGMFLSNNISNNANINYAGPPKIYGENDMCGNLDYYHIGLKHEVLPFLSFYQGFSKITISCEKIIIFNKSNTRVTTNMIDTTNNYKINQYDYYINSDIQLKNGLKLTPAFHYLHVGFTEISFDTVKHTGVITNTTTLNNYVFALAISKKYKLIDFSLFASTSNLNNLHQIVFGSTLNYFPWGDMNLYTSTTLSCVLEQNNHNGTPTRIIFDQMIGKKLFSKLWGEVSATLGNLTDYNEKNAFLVYNTFDNIIFKTGISLIYTLSPKIELSLRYQYLSRQDSYLTKINDKQTQQTIPTYTTTNYINNAIIGGIKWKL